MYIAGVDAAKEKEVHCMNSTIAIDNCHHNTA